MLATRAINRLATVQSLEQLGIAVYATDPRTVEQVLTSTERLGQLLGAGDAGRDAASRSARNGSTSSRNGLPAAEPRSVFFITWVDPLISVGRNTFLADALRLAGARSVIDTPQDWPNINLEEVVHLQPEYLIFSSDEPEQIQRQIAELARPARMARSRGAAPEPNRHSQRSHSAAPRRAWWTPSNNSRARSIPSALPPRSPAAPPFAAQPVSPVFSQRAAGAL